MQNNLNGRAPPRLLAVGAEEARPGNIRITIRMMFRMYASNAHSYTHLILALGIVREPTL